MPVDSIETALAHLQQDLKALQELIYELTRKVLNEKVSTLPIVVACSQPIALGFPLPAAALPGDIYYRYYLSTAEELRKNGLLSDEQRAKFTRFYPDPLLTACVLFILSPEAAQYVFFPLSPHPQDSLQI
jgi:hypothetical protein